MRTCPAVADKKLAHFQCTLSMYAVIFINPAAIASKLRSFLRSIHPQTPQNVTVVLSVNSLTFGTNTQGPHVKEHHQHEFGCAPDMMWLLQFWRLQALLLQRQLFSPWLVAVATTLITGNDPWHVVWVIQDLLMEILADSNTVLLLLWSQGITSPTSHQLNVF